MIAIKPQQILPLVMILLSVSAAIVYACAGDMRRTIYWIAAAVL